MIKLTKQEWDRMKRPIFPDIQYKSNGNEFQIQSMVELKQHSGDGVKYYSTYVAFEKINSLAELMAFVQDYTERGINLEILGEVDEDIIGLYKIREE